MMLWLKRLPLLPLAVVSIMLALAPFAPEPHLWQKLKMLFAGELVSPMDIFDLLMHGVPVSLLILRLALFGVKKEATG